MLAAVKVALLQHPGWGGGSLRWFGVGRQDVGNSP